MKILLVADHESRFIWDFFDPTRFEDIDLVLSAGDLKASYMEFLTTMLRKPVYYIHGNHDNKYLDNPPGGCTDIEDTITVVDGVRILGLGGSMRYKPGPLQYSELDMTKRIKKLKKTIEKHGGFDILLTHSPSAGQGDGKDLCHQGFDIFNQLIDIYKPSYFLHGHQHLNYDRKAKRKRTIDQTTVLNGYEYHIFEYERNDFYYNKKVHGQPDLKIPFDLKSKIPFVNKENSY